MFIRLQPLATETIMVRGPREKTLFSIRGSFYSERITDIEGLASARGAFSFVRAISTETSALYTAARHPQDFQPRRRWEADLVVP